MFHHSRSRVPSKAALRILYQLAYISSGTAAGLATLCAEERRRRTQFLQKIADNARRIRQSPRHVHNAAVAFADDSDEYQADHGELEYSEMQYVRKKKKVRRRRSESRSEENEWAARAPELPSKVASGYAQLVCGRRVGSKRREATTKVSNYAASREHPNEEGLGKQLKEGLRLYGGHSPKIVDSQYDVELWRASAIATGQRSTMSDLIVRRFKQSCGKLEPRLHGNNTSSSPVTSVSQLMATRLRPIRNYDGELDLATVSHDIEIFFSRTSVHSQHRGLQILEATHLLKSALKYGSLAMVRSLYLWKLSVGALSESEICATFEAGERLALREDHYELLDFYKDLSGELFVRGTSDVTTISALLTITAECQWWDLVADAKDTPFRANLRLASLGAVDSALSTICERLIEKGRPRHAVALIRTVRNSARWMRHRWRHLEDKIFYAALHSDQFWCCAELIRNWLRCSTNEDDCARYTEFILKCHARGQYGPLVRVLEDKHSRPALRQLCDRLGDEALVALTIACTKSELALETMWTKLFDMVPEDLRSRVVEARTATKLRETWAITRNIGLVERLYGSAHSWVASHYANNENSKLAIDLAMVEIYNRADRPTASAEMLRMLRQKHSLSSLSLTLIAVSLAKKAAWDEVEQLLGLVDPWGKFHNGKDVSRNVYQLLELYSKDHSAIEMWKFVTRLIETLGLLPTQETSEIVLEQFVTHGRFDLFASWMLYLRQQGCEWYVGTRSAVRLLKRYYLDQRPPHVLLYWQCKALSEHAPSIDVAQVINVIKAAIGHDARTKNKGLRLKAQQNLAILNGAQEQILAPVNSVREARVLKCQTNHMHRMFQGEQQQDNEQQDNEQLEGEQQRDERHRDEATAPFTQMEPAGNLIPLDHGANADNVAIAPGEMKEFSSTARFTPVETTDSLSSLNSTASPDDCAILPGAMAHLSAPQTSHIPSVERSASPQNHAMKGDDENDAGFHSVRGGLSPDQLERDMLLAYCLGQDKRVLELYGRSLSSSGLPLSRIGLDTAVDSSVRLGSGDPSKAEQMIMKAQNAGMNVTSAKERLVQSQILYSDQVVKPTLNQMRMAVLDYYNTREENGERVSYHLGVTAADRLIDCDRAQHGINVLDSIFHAERDYHQGWSMPVMTVYLKGFAALESLRGVQWVVDTVLRLNMRIDSRFLGWLRSSKENFGSGRQDKWKISDAQATRFTRVIELWRKTCMARRQQQRQETKTFGWKLVRCLARHANSSREVAVESWMRKQIEASLFGQAHKMQAPDDATPEELQAETKAAVTTTEQQAFEGVLTEVKEREATGPIERRLMEDLDMTRRPPAELQRNERLIRDADWLRMYRRFLHKPLVLDGRVICFRYLLDCDMEEDSFESVVARASTSQVDETERM